MEIVGLWGFWMLCHKQMGAIGNQDLGSCPHDACEESLEVSCASSVSGTLLAQCAGYSTATGRDVGIFHWTHGGCFGRYVPTMVPAGNGRKDVHCKAKTCSIYYLFDMLDASIMFKEWCWWHRVPIVFFLGCFARQVAPLASWSWRQRHMLLQSLRRPWQNHSWKN